MNKWTSWSQRTRKYKLHYSRVRRDFLRPPHGINTMSMLILQRYFSSMLLVVDSSPQRYHPFSNQCFVLCCWRFLDTGIRIASILVPVFRRYWYQYCVKTGTSILVLQWLEHLWDNGLDIGSSSYWRLLIAPGQKANGDNLGISFRTSMRRFWWVHWTYILW